MTLALICLGGFSLLELLLWVSPLWKWHKPVAGLLVLGVSVTTGAVCGLNPSLWSVLLVVLSIYRLINLLRLLEGRTLADYLYQSARRCSLLLIGSQLVVVGLAVLNRQVHVRPVTWWFMLGSVQLVAAAILLASTRRHLRTTEPSLIEKSYADQDLPPLTVAIPARNETDDLEACLQSLITNNYPKLEILVLDDCSQEKRTPEIIRQFAHDGVRFIAGTVPPQHWLPKNYAYKQLASEANGELLLFCGVDTRLEADSLRHIVETLLHKRKTMLSIMPTNRLPGGWSWESLLVQPGRYAWELALPRRLLNRPPVLSTCWLISSQALHAAGGFQAVASSNSPESFFARASARASDGYSFVRSDAAIGLASTKSLAGQRDTAIRTRYPQTHRRPELVGLLSLVELAVLVAPFGLLIGSLVARNWPLVILSSLSCVLLLDFFSSIVALTYRRFLLRGTWLLPFAAIYDVGLLNYSMWQYEFREIIWKGRNVCIPIMRVIPQLPKVE